MREAAEDAQVRVERDHALPLDVLVQLLHDGLTEPGLLGCSLRGAVLVPRPIGSGQSCELIGVIGAVQQRRVSGPSRPHHHAAACVVA